MKLAFQGTINYGGQGTFLLELTRHLANKIDDVHIFPTSLSAGRDEMREICENLPSNVIIHESSNVLKNLIDEARFFREFDVVHVNYATLGLSALLAKKLYDVPYVYTIHPPPNLFFGGPLTKLIYKTELDVFLPFMSKNGRAVTTSKYNQGIIRDKYRLSVDVVPLGIDSNKFIRSGGTRNIVREKLGLGSDDVTLLFVGRFHEYKDVPTLIRATSRVVERNRKIKLVIVGGGGDSYRQVKNEIRERNLIGNVILIENASNDDLYKYYAGADIFVFPSIGEGFGLVLLEAMASGLAIIAANAGASPEVIGDAGVLFEGKNSDDLSKKIIELISNKGLLTDLKEKGLIRVTEFTWEKTAQQYYEIYEEILDR